MGYAIVERHNYFVSTQNNLNSNSKGYDIDLSLASVDMSCGDYQHFMLILKQFNCHKSWTNVNANNAFFVINHSSTNYTLELDNLNFISIQDLVENFAEKINDSLITAGSYASGTIVVNNPINLNTNNVFDFTITTNTAHGFSDGDISLYANVSLGDFFELLGVKRSKTDNTTNGWVMTSPTATTLNFRGFYNCQLATESYIYLRCSLVNSCIATRNYDTGSVDTNGDNTDFSQILAKIPIQNDVLAYDSSTSDEYTTRLNNTKNLNYLKLYITDSKGRSIPLINPEQDTLGNRNFECVIEIQSMMKLGAHPNHFKSGDAPLPRTTAGKGFKSFLST